MSEPERVPILDFFVQGHPAPGGSKNFFPVWTKGGKLIIKKTAKGNEMPLMRVVDDAGKGNKEWRKIVGWEAKRAMAFKIPIAGRPLQWKFNFWLKRPQAEINAAGELKLWAKKHHLSAPDVLKLCRSTEDAMTGIVWHDDAQVVCGSFSKQYCAPKEVPGCRIRIFEI